MIKLVDILKEINIQSKTHIGQGSEQTAYPSKIKPGFVIKKFTGNNTFTTKDDWIKQIKNSQQYPDVFAEIEKFDFDKGYFIQEKLDEKSLTNDGVELYKYLKSNNKLPKTWPSEYPMLDIASIFYIEWEDKPDLINLLDDTPWENTLKPKLKRFFDKLNKHGLGYNSKSPLGDIRFSNIGYDKNGEIKILDFSSSLDYF